jgi:hypothetical protein
MNRKISSGQSIENDIMSMSFLMVCSISFLFAILHYHPIIPYEYMRGNFIVNTATDSYILFRLPMGILGISLVGLIFPLVLFTAFRFIASEQWNSISNAKYIVLLSSLLITLFTWNHQVGSFYPTILSKLLVVILAILVVNTYEYEWSDIRYVLLSAMFFFGYALGDLLGGVFLLDTLRVGIVGGGGIVDGLIFDTALFYFAIIAISVIKKYA